MIDFEGEPLRPIEDRRRPDSPLRDAASMRRSLDHVARSARRRAERENDADRAPGLDGGGLDRARTRTVHRRVRGRPQRRRAPIVVDLDLLDAFEVAKEAYEFETGDRAALVAVGAARRDALLLERGSRT